MRDPIDLAAYVWFAALAIGLPLAGFAMMGVDYRAYVRSLRRALAVVAGYRLTTPQWALRDRPACLQELGLDPGCTRDDVFAAYRRRVKRVHPDHGGDRRDFERLQRRLAEALELVAAEDAKRAGREPPGSPPGPG